MFPLDQRNRIVITSNLTHLDESYPGNSLDLPLFTLEKRGFKHKEYNEFLTAP